MITSPSPVTTPAVVASAAAVGCAFMKFGEGANTTYGLIVPQICAPASLAVDPGRALLQLNTPAGPLCLRGLPDQLLRQYQAGRGIVVAADTLTEVSAVWNNGTALKRSEDQKGVLAAFNGFLTAAVRAGSITITKISVGFRQPEVEAFVRKLAVSLGNASPSNDIQVTARQLTAMQGKPSGPQTVSDTAYTIAFANPRFKMLGDAYRNDRFEALPTAIAPTHDDFAALRLVAYTSLTIGSAPRETAANAMATVGAGLATAAGKAVDVSAEVLAGADSVFLQSYSDCYALMVLAKFSERDALLALLRDIYARRANSGDFTLYSAAPMSHDTEAALSMLEGFLERLPFSRAERHAEMVDNVLALALEATDLWMQERGVKRDDSLAIVHRAEKTFRLLD